MPEEDVLPEDIPYPEELQPRRFFAGQPDEVTPVAPLPLGTMNAVLPSPSREVVPPYPQVYATANDNAYTAEAQAAANVAMSARDRLYAQKAKQDAQEAATRYAGFQKYNNLIKGGASPEEALRYSLGELLYSDPDKMASSLSHLRSGITPGSISAVPIIDPKTQRVLGHSVFSDGRVQSTHFADPNRLTPDESTQKQLIMGEINADRVQLGRLQRMKGNIQDRALNPNLDADIAALTSRIRANSDALTNRAGIPVPEGIAPAKAPAPKAIDTKRADQIRASFRDGKISKDDALAQLKAIGFE